MPAAAAGSRPAAHANRGPGAWHRTTKQAGGLPLEPLDLGGEDVAAPAYRPDHRRLFRVVFETAPKTADLHVDRPIGRPGLAVSSEIQQPVAGQHLIGVVDERREQIEFTSGQPDLFARRRDQLPVRKINVPAGEPCLRSRRRLLFRGLDRGPTQHGFDHGQQLAQVERLWQVVIGAHFEADDAVDNLAAAGQHDDPDAKILSQPAGEGQSVLAGQHQIEGDEIDRGLRHDPSHSRAVLRDRDPVALAGQIFLDQVADLALIIDDQNVTVVVHAASFVYALWWSDPGSDDPRQSTRTECYKLLHEIG